MSFLLSITPKRFKINVADTVKDQIYGHYCIRNKLRAYSFLLTLSLLMSYIYGASCKARNFNVVYI
jgi:hypothetical protein